MNNKIDISGLPKDKLLINLLYNLSDPNYRVIGGCIIGGNIVSTSSDISNRISEGIKNRGVKEFFKNPLECGKLCSSMQADIEIDISGNIADFTKYNKKIEKYNKKDDEKAKELYGGDAKIDNPCKTAQEVIDNLRKHYEQNPAFLEKDVKSYEKLVAGCYLDKEFKTLDKDRNEEVQREVCNIGIKYQNMKNEKINEFIEKYPNASLLYPSASQVDQTQQQQIA